MRTLLSSGDPRAAEAVDLFVYRIGRELGSLAAALGGLDALVFTGGIGENAPSIRARVCRDAEWLGPSFDPEANEAGAVRSLGRVYQLVSSDRPARILPMTSIGQTCWDLIRGAAAGQSEDRDEFTRRYLPSARAYFCARWEGTTLIQSVEDAVQEVFLDFFRSGGAFDRLDELAAGGFKPFFFGVVRTTALHFETRRARAHEREERWKVDSELILAREKSISTLMDRTWALALIDQAVDRHSEWARAQGSEALRRVELLRLRFQEGMPIRDIAAKWQEVPARIHKEYARARQEFRCHLTQVVAAHGPGEPGEVERRLKELLAAFR
jgi:RNA polymerase sigma factor (sigma-70 family)